MAISAPCWPQVAASDALARVDKQLALYPLDRRLWRLAAQTHAQLGHRLLSHRAQAEAAALSGNLIAAIEQISLGIKAGDGSFHEMSAAEARRREWQADRKIAAQELDPERTSPILARLVGIYPAFWT